MTARNRFALLGLVLLLPATIRAQGLSSQSEFENYRLRAEYRWFSTTLEGTAAKGVFDVPGTTFDVKADLGLVDERTWEGRATIRVGQRWKLRGAYTALDYKGQVDLARRIRFDDTVFQAGENVASSLKGGYYGGDLEWDLVMHPKGFLGFFGGARVPDVDVVISSPDQSKRELSTYRPVLPVVGVVGRTYTGKVSVEGFASTFAKVDGRKVTEFEIAARIHFSSRLAISGGYRYVSFNAETGADFADFKVTGWTYGVELGL